MAQSAPKLNELLLDKNNQDRIEKKIVQRLLPSFFDHVDNDDDWQEILNQSFYQFLVECEQIRGCNLKPEEEQVPQGNSMNELNAIQQHQLANHFVKNIGFNIILNLYSPNREIQATSLQMIKELNIMSKEEYQKYAILFEFINQIFYHSRHLLAVTLAPQIIDQYVSKYIGSTNRPVIESYESKGIKRNKKEICKFRIDGEPYICEFSKKLEGKFFGSVVQIRSIDGSKSKKYYLKAHQGYPATNEKDSYDAFKDTINRIVSIEEIRNSSSFTKLHSLDLREPFMYKLLDELGFGPKTYIMINPYVIFGLFIVTEDLTLGNNLFYNVDEFNSKIKIDQILNYDSPAQQFLTKSVTELSMLSCIFSLLDLHSQNWGFVAREEAIQDLLELKNPSTSPQIRIIDFQQFTDFNTSSKDHFLQGKILGLTSDSFSTVLEAFDKLDNTSKTQCIDVDTYVKSYITKIKQGKAAYNQLLERLHGQKIDKFMRKIETDLIKQIKQYPLIQDHLTRKPTTRKPTTLKPTTLKPTKITTLKQKETNVNKREIRSKVKNKMDVLESDDELNDESNDESNQVSEEESDEDFLESLNDPLDNLTNYCISINNNYRALKIFLREGYKKYLKDRLTTIYEEIQDK